MKSAKHPFRNILLPLMILCPLLWVMVGCLYVPWFEHRIDSGPNVRALVGDAGSDRQIRPGHITRQQVIALLGEAPFISSDGMALAYIARTNRSAWVWPLCFTVEPADAKAYAVRLIFDERGSLTRFDWADAEASYPPMSYLFGRGTEFNLAYRDNEAIQKLNTSDPILYSRNPRYHWDQPRRPTTTRWPPG